MDTHLDGGSSAPLYQQVLDLLKSDIEQGTYPVDSQIPTELELSKMYGVGRVTVRRAIEELVGEGYLTKRQGAWYVCDRDKDNSQGASEGRCSEFYPSMR